MQIIDIYLTFPKKVTDYSIKNGFMPCSPFSFKGKIGMPYWEKIIILKKKRPKNCIDLKTYESKTKNP